MQTQRYTSVGANIDPELMGANIYQNNNQPQQQQKKRDPLNPTNHFAEDATPTKNINVSLNRFPYCIVWSPLPVISWFCPVIGHMGICDSQGIIWDFAGPYSINRNDMAFGSPTRYLQLDPSKIKAALDGGVKNSERNNGEMSKIWDDCVHHTNCHYSQRMHNICCQNCHHHTARALAQMKYRNLSSWSQITLAFWIFFRAPFTSFWGFMYTFGPFMVILGLILWSQLG